jgi:hypothetical protein
MQMKKSADGNSLFALTERQIKHPHWIRLLLNRILLYLSWPPWAQSAIGTSAITGCVTWTGEQQRRRNPSPNCRRWWRKRWKWWTNTSRFGVTRTWSWEADFHLGEDEDVCYDGDINNSSLKRYCLNAKKKKIVLTYWYLIYKLL